MDTIEIDKYILDVLMPDLVGHDRKPSAFIVYLAVWQAGNGGRVALSNSQLAMRTGLSKRSVQDAVLHLTTRGLLSQTRRTATDTCAYVPLTPWHGRKKPQSS